MATRAAVDQLLRRRFFYTESFSIYQQAPNFAEDIRGLFDLGPPGTALQNNILKVWRHHFVIHDGMLEIDCPILTPTEVLKTSGHTDRFTDLMCKDTKTNDSLRADHLIEEVIEARLANKGKSFDAPKHAKNAPPPIPHTTQVKLDDNDMQEYKEILAKIEDMNENQLGELIEKLEIRNPSTNNKVSPPKPFNLMFSTTIGPHSASPGYLRPETAQGQFLNFKKLWEYNQRSMPFASASIGKSFRNEISPRSGLLRVREFLMAEIEHYVDPNSKKSHPRFEKVKSVELNFLDRTTQENGRLDVKPMTVATALDQKVLQNQTMAYYLARIYIFLSKIGADMQRVRFRQHMANEMAHYASDCWDVELSTSYGWIECVGCADRSAFDLRKHSERTKHSMLVEERLPEPVQSEWFEAVPNTSKLGPKYRANCKTVVRAIEDIPQSEREHWDKVLSDGGTLELDVQFSGTEGTTQKVILDKDLVQFERQSRTEVTRKYEPHVIEPSFGIGRLLYSLLEQSYQQRKVEEVGEAREFLRLSPLIAPTKVTVCCLSKRSELFKMFVQDVIDRLHSHDIAIVRDDTSASIGKRYARSDEIGTPLAITIDVQSLDDHLVTLRDRDSMVQIRDTVERVVAATLDVVTGQLGFDELISKRGFAKFEGQTVKGAPTSEDRELEGQE